MRERDIERTLVGAIQALGGEVRKVQWTGRRGAPDRVVMLAGRTIWVELKRPGEVPASWQEREHGRMRAMGQRVLVIDSLPGVERLVAELRDAS